MVSFLHMSHVLRPDTEPFSDENITLWCAFFPLTTENLRLKNAQAPLDMLLGRSNNICLWAMTPTLK